MPSRPPSEQGCDTWPEAGDSRAGGVAPGSVLDTLLAMTRSTRAVAALVAALLCLSACSDGDTTGSAPEASAPGVGTGDGSVGFDRPACDEESLGTDGDIEFTTARYVVDGALGEVCFGGDDPALTSAWEDLSTITPPEQLDQLALFGGFASAEDGQDETLAFVNVLTDDGEFFQMSVNLGAFDADPDEATLTMAHEFSHVFTQAPGQLDRTVVDPEDCGTYFNGEGCYLPDSLMARWVADFWDPSELASIDPMDEPGVEDGAGRCADDPGFFGSYAATTPEEDFAEAFSAYVFRLAPENQEQQVRLDWFAAESTMAEYRERATAAGIGPLENNFDLCGV